MEKKINLKELSAKHGFINGFTIHSNSTLAQQALNNLLLEFGKQLLELAAGNAEEYYSTSDEKLDESLKQSILDTIKQIE
jgi:hypothetical protein